MTRFLTIFIVLAMAWTTTASAAGTRGADTLPTAAGPLAIHPIHHASFVMDWNDLTLYVDPVGPASRYAGLGRPDIVLITHAHHDHFSPETLAALDTTGAIIVMPPSVADRLDEATGRAHRSLANGDSARIHGIRVHAVPAYNLPPSPDAYHPKGWGNGYVLTLGGKRVYISGDTEGIPAMRSLKDIDLAFVCMNLPYTMDVPQAADAVADFKPGIVYPYHYRGQDPHLFKHRLHARAPDVEVRLRDWYPDTHDPGDA